MWLEAFASHVKEGVNVTTPQDIAASWSNDLLAQYDDQSPEFQERNFSVRVTVFLNGQRDSGRVIIMPTSMDLLIARCSLLYNVALVKAFNHRGQLLESSREISDNDVLVVAPAGADFDMEALPVQARHYDDVVDSSSEEEEEEDVGRMLHRLNTEILALEDKPGYKKKRQAAAAAAKGDKIARIANLGVPAQTKPKDGETSQLADNDDADDSDGAAGVYTEPELQPMPAEHEAGYVDPEPMHNDNDDNDDQHHNRGDSSDSSDDEAAAGASTAPSLVEAASVDHNATHGASQDDEESSV
jgi:hypothetical protein